MGSRDREIEVTTHGGERKSVVWVVEIEKQKLLPTGAEKSKDMLPVLLLH
ncbi:MAG: hypothetical protein IJO70_05035 [Lachnospiraceae bacterium]|nr:hypothetical protein [Lachnospiraceae bacterium]